MLFLLNLVPKIYSCGASSVAVFPPADALNTPSAPEIIPSLHRLSAPPGPGRAQPLSSPGSVGGRGAESLLHWLSAHPAHLRAPTPPSTDPGEAAALVGEEGPRTAPPPPWAQTRVGHVPRTVSGQATGAGSTATPWARPLACPLWAGSASSWWGLCPRLPVHGGFRCLAPRKGVLSSLPRPGSRLLSMPWPHKSHSQHCLQWVLQPWTGPRGPSASPDPRVPRWGNSGACLCAVSVSPTRLRLFW